MHILQRIILICKLNAEGLCKAVTEVVARTGLQRLAVMHQRLQSYRLPLHPQIFLCLSCCPLDHRNRQYLLSKNPRTHSASGSYAPLLLQQLHVPYGLPATKTLWSAGTDGLSFSQRTT